MSAVLEENRLGLGFAGAEDVTICFSSAGRRGEKAVILCSEVAGEWVLFICMCVHVEGGGRGDGKVLKKRGAL